MGQSWPLFCLLLFFSHYNFNTNWKKHRWCAWDSNLGPQDGRHRQNHGAIAATLKIFLLCDEIKTVNSSARPTPMLEYPPHGFTSVGNAEDSLQNCRYLRPRAPKRDVRKLLEHAGKVPIACQERLSSNWKFGWCSGNLLFFVKNLP